MACHRSDTPARPFANLDRLGLIDERLIAVHMTQLSADEIARCGEARVNVVHCPSSNLKLASGMCPIARLHAAGANVCIGTDSTASNNTLDMWGEMRLAALLAKAVCADPTAVPALTALRMATINGARALGLGDRCGSLEVGKACDAIAVDLSAPEFAPMYDVVSHLVYVADRRAVTDVWCAGARLMRNRRLVTVNEAEIVRAAREWQSQIAAHRDEAARAASGAAGESAGAGAQSDEHGQEAAAPASEAAATEEK
jgi:5-methylthioadenosine/S-adenosylhomocysteine deaminase